MVDARVTSHHADRMAAELADWTAANQRAREAYSTGRSPGVCLVCECGRRTTHGSGQCKRCRS